MGMCNPAKQRFCDGARGFCCPARFAGTSDRALSTAPLPPSAFLGSLWLWRGFDFVHNLLHMTGERRPQPFFSHDGRILALFNGESLVSRMVTPHPWN